MALNTPIAISLSAFDATNEQVFSFTVIGGDQVVGNKLTIIDNVSGDIVYTNEVQSYIYNQTLPANTLTNGGYYGFYFQTIDIYGNYSAQSNMLTFKCFTTPTFTFSNIPAIGIIESASYNFYCQYNQAEDEPIDYFHFYLYNNYRQQIDQSGIITSDMALPDIAVPTFEHTFNGFMDDETYYIRALGVTVNGTEVDSGYISFTINYQYDGTYLMVDSQNYPNHGYVLVSNNASEIDGKMYDKYGNPIEPDIRSEQAYMLNGNTLVWDEGFQFKNNQFTKIKWWTPVNLGETLKMSNGEDTYITIELKRGVPSSDGYYAKDYILIKGYENGIQYMQHLSNLIDPVNNNSQLVSLVNVDNNDVNVIFDELIGGDTAIWDGASTLIFGRNEMTYVGEESHLDNYFDVDTGASNVEFDKITDIFLEDEVQFAPLEDENIIGSPAIPTELTKVILENSIVDKIYISKNNITEIPSELPVWDNGTVLKTDFENDSPSAGNVDWLLSKINNIKVKRRLKGTFNYITLYKHEINSISDITFSYKDYWLPSGYDFEYALVPCADDDEGIYYFTEVTTCFNGLFVSDGEKTMKIYSNYLINTAQDNQLIGTAQPYGSRYPVIIRNPNVNYRSVTIQGDILGLEDDEFVFTMDRNKIVKQKNEWDVFLTNGKMKLIKDWNGNILMGGITTAPSYTYNIINQNAIPTLTFTITEQGQYNSQKDLYNNGFTNVPS